MNIEEVLQNKLNARESNNSFRTLKGENSLIDFSSNDYLGLSHNRELQSIVADEYKRTDRSLGSGGSRLLAGDSVYFHDLEKLLASIHRSEDALLFNSGYAANQAVFATIPQRGDVVLYDELIHACVKDGLRLGLAKHYSFRHNDLNDLEKRLSNIEGSRVFVAVESIYSMDGDECPLQGIAGVCGKYGAKLIVDEAHSTGILGSKGEGLVCSLGLENDVFIRVHTFGKGIGAHGACVIASSLIKQYLVNFSRQFIYTTSAPIHSLVSIKCAFEYIGQNSGLINRLKENIELFKKTLKTDTLSRSAIQPVLIPGNENVKRVANILAENGFDVRPVMSPTIKEGSERLRICLHATDRRKDIEQLAKLINDSI